MNENSVRTRKIRTAGIHNLESLIFEYERLIEDNNGFAEIREIETLDTLRACSEEIHRLNLELNAALSEVGT